MLGNVLSTPPCARRVRTACTAWDRMSPSAPCRPPSTARSPHRRWPVAPRPAPLEVRAPISAARVAPAVAPIKPRRLTRELINFSSVVILYLSESIETRASSAPPTAGPPVPPPMPAPDATDPPPRSRPHAVLRPKAPGPSVPENPIHRLRSRLQHRTRRQRSLRGNRRQPLHIRLLLRRQKTASVDS